MADHKQRTEARESSSQVNADIYISNGFCAAESAINFADAKDK